MSVLHLIHMNCMKWHKYIDEVMVFQDSRRLADYSLLFYCVAKIQLQTQPV